MANNFCTNRKSFNSDNGTYNLSNIGKQFYKNEVVVLVVYRNICKYS